MGDRVWTLLLQLLLCVPFVGQWLLLRDLQRARQDYDRKCQDANLLRTWLAQAESMARDAQWRARVLDKELDLERFLTGGLRVHLRKANANNKKLQARVAEIESDEKQRKDTATQCSSCGTCVRFQRAAALDFRDRDREMNL